MWCSCVVNSSALLPFCILLVLSMSFTVVMYFSVRRFNSIRFLFCCCKIFDNGSIRSRNLQKND